MKGVLFWGVRYGDHFHELPREKNVVRHPMQRNSKCRDAHTPKAPCRCHIQHFAGCRSSSVSLCAMILGVRWDNDSASHAF